MSANLCLHAGGNIVTREALAEVLTPEPTETWFPVAHTAVLEAVTATLGTAGFAVRKESLAIARGGNRFFGVLDLATDLAPGVNLSVGVRNSIDKSFPMGMVAGNRVFVCDNLAFSAEILVRRKHTKLGEERYREGIAVAIGKLGAFQQTEAVRILAYREEEIDSIAAESLILRAFKAEIVSTKTLPAVIKHWDTPEHDDFQPRTLWSLFNAFTSALGGMAVSNPQDHAKRTMSLRGLLDPVAGLALPVNPTPTIEHVVDHDDDYSDLD
jgi:hypothetical protein